VVAQYRDPRFREALKWMASLYRQGFIVPDSFTMTGDQLKALWQGSTPRVAILAATWMNGFTDQGTERWINTIVLPAIAGPNGERNASNGEPWTILGGRMFITDKVKNPEHVYALYDYMQNFDVMLDGYIGPKGTAWADPDPGASSLSGGPALYKLLISYGNDALNTVWDQANPMIRSSKFRLGEQATNTREAEQWLTTHSNDTALMNKLLADNSYPEQMWYRTSLANSKYAMKDELFLPPIGMEEADNNRYADINAVLAPFLDTTFTEFVTGIRDINSDAAWNAYLAELDQLNQPEAIRILQKYIK
jgi:putative aldouronate transport system substrate-binding protein